MEDEAGDIQNRPKELEVLPNYTDFPDENFIIKLEHSTGEFLAHDLRELIGSQPVEGKILSLMGGEFDINPPKEVIKFYGKRGDDFQMVNIVVSCYAFDRIDGQLVGLPYHISLRPAQKRGSPQHTGPGTIDALDLETLRDGFPRYMGYNPFSNAFGLFVKGAMAVPKGMHTDVVGIVYNSYFVSSKYDRKDVLLPASCIGLLGARNALLKDYQDFRCEHYFKHFKKTKPRKIWGCDSPIELFLLQGMGALGLRPQLQVMIFPDGSTFPLLHEMWRDGRRSKAFAKKITEVDFYFESNKLAVFCDSVAYHSSEEAIAKDKAIDEKLERIGIKSLRISGPDIMRSPMECAKYVQECLNSRV
ncbi:hypothetical protein DFS21_11290 [Pseudomonas sp. 2848]|uniref:endonuclease domain-containing protein n=1 Tax=Pseudomonas sp. 2848 TaxID=2183926 RepID=UPI000DAF24F2|nr:hypothetical protein [Pseudomonas sp. 2848]PZW75573.1 hypothetical protein DFS21_11290 [Pseudomonas sp. 2848]